MAETETSTPAAVPRGSHDGTHTAESESHLIRGYD
jgi:hypothetical protein